MGKEKINQQDLVALLAEHGAFATKTEAARFLTALQEVFQETLLTEKNVKLNGIGTFRLQWVEPRRSVDVRTGEAINIAGHDKLAFAADVVLKEALGAPTAENDEPKEMPLKRLTEQANEIKDILSEINDAAVEPPIVEPPLPEPQVEEAAEPQEPTDAPTPLPSDDATPEIPETPATDTDSDTDTNIQPIAEQPAVPAPTDEQQALIKAIVDNAVRTPQPAKKRHVWVWILVAILLVLGGGIAASCYWYGDIIRTWCEDKWADTRAWFDDCIARCTPDEQTVSCDATDSLTAQPDTAVAPTFDTLRVYDHFVGTEHIVKGVHLAQLARKYYGHTEFWVYIYEANRHIMATPDALEVGMMLQIPALDARLVDATDTAAVNYAHRLGETYKKIGD